MSEKLTTAQMIASVMAAIGGLVADKTNTFDKYDYISADNVLRAANQEMAKVGLSVVPSTLHDRFENLGNEAKRLWFCRVEMQMILKGGSDELEQKPIDWVGYGTDYKLPDKALYKAITSGHKYFLMKLFNIGVDNTDSEHDIPDEKEAKPKPIRNPVQTKPQQPQPKQDKQTQNKPLNEVEYINSLDVVTYGDVQAAMLMSGQLEDEKYAMDMINSYDNFPAEWYDETGKLKGEIKPEKKVSKESALAILNWCLNKSKEDNNE